MGCVMHFEMVEEPVHEALPTTDDVLAYLKKSLKEGDNSVIYEITDISDGVHTIVEYPPHTPHVEFSIYLTFSFYLNRFFEIIYLFTL